MPPTYEPRRCTECGKEFSPAYAAQITCGKECQRKRKNRSLHEYNVKRHVAERQYVADLEAKVKELEAQLEKANAANTEQIMPLREELAATKGECERLKDELAKVKEELETLRNADIPELPNPEPDKQKQKPCKNCGKLFTPKYPWAVYCCKDCARAFKNKQVSALNKQKSATPTQPLPQDIIDKMNYCERLKLKSMSPLPCGTRYECEGCEMCPEGATPIPRFNSDYEQTDEAV